MAETSSQAKIGRLPDRGIFYLAEDGLAQGAATAKCNSLKGHGNKRLRWMATDTRRFGLLSSKVLR
jgi:hypothetical protein